MAITPEEKKRRQAVMEREKHVISKLNDISDIRERVRRDKALNNDEVDQVEEQPQRKIAKPSTDSDKSL